MTLSACIHSLHTVGKTTYRSNSTIDNVCYYVVVVVVVVLIINTYHLSKFLLFYSMTKYGIFFRILVLLVYLSLCITGHCSGMKYWGENSLSLGFSVKQLGLTSYLQGKKMFRLL